jgi:UDP-N-acetylglucosamine:LPS N-acetylglucosamine transferase
MSQADLGFSALGLTTYEMAYMGVPVLLIPGTGFNAEVAQRYTSAYSFATYVGEGTDLTPPDVAASFTGLARDAEDRERMAARGSEVVGSKANQVVAWVAGLATQNALPNPIE